MVQPNMEESQRLGKQVMCARELDLLLNILLSLDRAVVELSMHVYKIPRYDRILMREQNRRLHAAVRERLPRLRGRAQVSLG